MRAEALRRVASGLALVMLVVLGFTYGRLCRSIESAATAAGIVDSDVASR